MAVKALETLFSRDLEALIKELRSFSSEEGIWSSAAGVKNSSGHIALHVCGNLKHFIGSELGGFKYQRDREYEFNAEPIDLTSLVKEVDAANLWTSETLSRLTSIDLEKTYPIMVFGEEMKTGFFLMHLHGHLNYHLGQINYLRRIISK